MSERLCSSSSPCSSADVCQFDVQDRRFMQLALRIATSGLGRTAPNPAVGALIADESTGDIIARGCTQPGGRPHAETVAIILAGTRARGKTLYLTLEPCSHYGRTPPCADAILKAGLARVVCAVEDPDPRVSGKGVALLREAGVKVDLGLCAEEGRWIAAGHFLRVTQGRPFVQLELDMSHDGPGAPRRMDSQCLIAPIARARNLIRMRADAVLLGRAGNPDADQKLTCYLGPARAPARPIVLDAALRTPPIARLQCTLSDGPPTIIGRPEAAAPHYTISEVIERAPSNGARVLDAHSILSALYEDGVTRVLVEGGPTVARSFLDAGVVDEAIIFCSRHRLDSIQPPIFDVPFEVFEDKRFWRLTNNRTVGTNQLRRYRARAWNGSPVD